MQANGLRERLSATTRGYVTLEVPPRPALDLRAAEALARAADEVPCREDVRRSTGRSVSAVYAEILGATRLAPEVTRDGSPAQAVARRLLFVDDRERVPTRLFKDYLRHKQAFDAARAAGRAAQALWSALQTAQPGRVEAALATLSQHGQTDLGAAFSAARAMFVAGQRESADGPYQVCSATPPNFWASEARRRAAGSADVGRLLRVTLERPWLHLALLSRDGWAVSGREAGAYSNGRADESNTGQMAFVPVALFVAWTENGASEIVAWENVVVPSCPPRAAPL